MYVRLNTKSKGSARVNSNERVLISEQELTHSTRLYVPNRQIFKSKIYCQQLNKVKSPLPSRQCWLIRRKARVCTPGQASKRNMKKKKLFLRRLPLSRFLAKTLESKLTCHEKVSQKICCSESTLNCRSRHSRIKLTHTT